MAEPLNVLLAGEHRVTVIKDTTLKYPELWMNIHLTGPKGDQNGFTQMFARARCSRADSPDAADLVVFTGGADVNPDLYETAKHPSTHFDAGRDAEDIATYKVCLEKGIPMLGVCRGAQFLHVMNGGRLFQDVDGHTGDHGIWDKKLKTMIPKISSVHHQLVMDNTEGGMEVLAHAHGKSTRRAVTPTMSEVGPNLDIEAFFYRDSCCIGVQGHPEYAGFHAFTVWTLNLIDQYVICNPDTDWVGKHRRIKPDLLAQREGFNS